MRVRVAVVTLLVFAGAQAYAQVRGVMLPVPPLPPIGLPLPHIGLPPADDAVPPASAEPATGQERARRPQRRAAVRPVLVYSPVIIEADRTPGTGQAVPPPSPHFNHPEGGMLELAVSGTDAYQVFVDGYFAGSSDRLGRWLSLEQGPHEIELRADGFRATTFRVRIAAGQTVTYTHALTGDDSAPHGAPVAASAPPMGTVYVIAGCYAGNVPPAQVMLPAGCDPRDAVTLVR